LFKQWLNLWKIFIGPFKKQKSVGLPVGVHQQFTVHAFPDIRILERHGFSSKIQFFWKWQSIYIIIIYNSFFKIFIRWGILYCVDAYGTNCDYNCPQAYFANRFHLFKIFFLVIEGIPFHLLSNKDT